MEFFVMQIVEVKENGEARERHVNSWLFSYVIPGELWDEFYHWITLVRGGVNLTRAGRFARESVSVHKWETDRLESGRVRVRIFFRRDSKWVRIGGRKFLKKHCIDFRKMLRKLAKYKSA